MGLKKLYIYLSILIFSFVFLLFLCTNNFIFLIIILGIGLFLCRIKFKRYWLVLFIISFFIRLVFIIVANFPQVYDFATLLDASHMFSLGDYSFSSWFHFHTWGYQTAFVIYQGFLLKLFGSEFLLKVLNIFYSSCLVIFIYFMGRRISDEKSARIVSFLYMIFPFPLFLNSVLCNHHLSCLLMYLGIFFLIKKDKRFSDYVVGGVLISFGNIIRPEGIIVVLSFLVFSLFTFDKDKLFNTIIRMSAFIIVYFSIGWCANFLVIKSGVNDSGLKNHDPLWKFILGFNHDTCGYYTDDDTKYQIDRDTEIAIIKERALTDLGKTGKLMLCKIDRFWLSSGLDMESGSFTDKSFDVLGVSIPFSKLESVAININNYLYLCVFIMFLFGLFINRNRFNDVSLFFLIMIVITFFVFLFIEIQPRYAYFIHISLFILSTYGFEYVIKLLGKLFKKYRKNSVY